MYWLSPLLLVSIGLHGLALVIPIADKQDVVEEPEPELPEPIRVSDLPKVAPEPAPDPPILSEPTDTPPAPPPPVAIAPPPPVGQPPSAPDPTPPPNPKPKSDPDIDPDPAPPDNSSHNAGNQVVRQEYDATGTTEGERAIAGFSFAGTYGKAEEIGSVLTLNYPAAGSCFEAPPQVAVIALVIDKSGNIIHDEFLKKTGYPVIDNWLSDFMGFEPLPDDAFNGLGVSAGGMSDWINETRDRGENNDRPLVPADVEAAPYAVEIAVNITDNNCG